MKRKFGDQDVYFRFQTVGGSFELNDVKSLDEQIELADQYVQEVKVQAVIEKVAGIIVGEGDIDVAGRFVRRGNNKSIEASLHSQST